MTLYGFSESLDKDGDLLCYACVLDGSDAPVYITRDNFIAIAKAFGYVLALVPALPKESE